MSDLIRQVLDDMASCGIVPSDAQQIQFDTSEIVRFHVAGDKKGTLNGFWRGFSDGLPAGLFGSWKTGQHHNWCSKALNQISDDEQAALRQRIEALRQQRADEQALAQADAAKAATDRYNGLPDAGADNPYCQRKHIKPFNAKQEGILLVLAIRDWHGKIHSLQSIAPNGKKMLMKGGSKKGFHIYIGGNHEGRLLIAEGYATGASLREIYPDDEVIAAVDAYNLRAVAQASRDAFPDREIVIAGDHDAVGIRCAKAAALAVGGLVLIPPGDGQDWNDWAIAQGVSR
ncbi:MAG: toprim domain-containing protein [Acidithiobacillus sp.]